MKPRKTKPSRKKESSVQSRVWRAKKKSSLETSVASTSHVAARPRSNKSKMPKKNASHPMPTAQAAEDEVTALPPLPILKRVEPTKVNRETRVVGKKTKVQTPATAATPPSDFQSQVSASLPATRHSPPATPAPLELAAISGQITVLREKLSALTTP